MKIRLYDGIGITEGALLLADDLGVRFIVDEIGDGGEKADFSVTSEHSEDGALLVTVNKKSATVKAPTAGAFFRGLAKVVPLLRRGDAETEIREAPVFDDVGAMLDMSRNAAMSVHGVRTMLRRMALMGMTVLMLYTEDNYEVEGYPYFGHLRGRYSREELRGLDRYALALGIELVPCIQTSGHLATHLIWGAAAKYKDTSSTLLVGEDETYRLIHAMMRTVADCFTTRRIHIGMDEARDLGSGKYLERFGYRKRSEIFLEHLDRVSEIVRSYGFEPMMWSDMFFRLAADGKIPGYRDYDLRVEMTEEIAKKVPEGITQVFWDYYHDDEKFYSSNIDKHRKYFNNKLVFAGGVYLWCGHSPLYRLTLKNSIPALRACKDRGVREVLATVWLSGSEGAHILSLAGLALYADFAYRGEYDEDGVAECFALATGEEYKTLLALEATEHPDGGIFSLSRALLYNDPLMGNADANFAMLPLRRYYEKCTEEISGLTLRTPIFKNPHRTLLSLSRLLELKADFGIRLKAAYDGGDREALRVLCDECDEIIARIGDLRRAHRDSWLEYCKPEGWEVHDVRYGGLIARFDTVKLRISSYLAGECEEIGELLVPRLAIDCKEENIGKFTDVYTAIKYVTYSTVNVL